MTDENLNIDGTPAGGTVPLLYQAQNGDGEIRAVFGGLLSTDTGELTVTRLGSGDTIRLHVEEIQTLTSLFQEAVNRYVEANTPAETEPPSPVGDDGIPILTVDHQDEAPGVAVGKKSSPVRRAE